MEVSILGRISLKGVDFFLDKTVTYVFILRWFHG